MSIPKGFVTWKTLKEKRKWTIRLKREFLPEPHLVIPNPHNPAWSDMKLFDLRIVQEIEQLPEFKGYQPWGNWFSGHMKKLAQERRAAQSHAAETQQAAPA
jgi:hypothetical protein